MPYTEGTLLSMWMTPSSSSKREASVARFFLPVSETPAEEKQKSSTDVTWIKIIPLNALHELQAIIHKVRHVTPKGSLPVTYGTRIPF
jgi:hypothetical protein